jgi:hypothetical protein
MRVYIIGNDGITLPPSPRCAQLSHREPSSQRTLRWRKQDSNSQSPAIIMPAVRCGRGCRVRFRRLYSQPGSASAGSDQRRTARRFEMPHLAALCGGSAARPAEPINQQRVCLVVS